MPNERAGYVEPCKDAKGGAYYRARIHLADGSRPRFRVPDEHARSAKSAEAWARWLQREEDSTTPHGMTVETARDYSANFDADIATWTDAQIATFPLEQMRHTPTQQKCMSVSVRFTDQVPTTLGAGTGAGPIMRSALLRLRAKRGEWKRTSIGQQG